MTSTETIINHLLEAEDDFDWKDVDRVGDMREADTWLASVMPSFGFKYQEMGCRGWEKETHAKAASVGVSTKPGEALMVLYRRTTNNRWQNEEMLSVPCGELVLKQLSDWQII